jgi:elongation factor G
MLVDILAKIAPSAAESTVNCIDGENESAAAVDENGPAALVVFKTIADPFVGKLSYFKVVSGTVKADSRLISRRTGNEEKLSKVMWIKAGKQEDAPAIVADHQ